MSGLLPCVLAGFAGSKVSVFQVPGTKVISGPFCQAQFAPLLMNISAVAVIEAGKSAANHK
jgi:hypothetical protein